MSAESKDAKPKPAKAEAAELLAEMKDDEHTAELLLEAYGEELVDTLIVAAAAKQHLRTLSGLLKRAPAKYRMALTAVVHFNNQDTIREFLQTKGVRWDVAALYCAYHASGANKETKALLCRWLPLCNGIYCYDSTVDMKAGPITREKFLEALKEQARLSAEIETGGKCDNRHSNIKTLREWAASVK